MLPADRRRPCISELSAAELRARAKEYSDSAATACMAGVAQSLWRLADMYGRLAEAKEAADLDRCEDSNAADGGECTTANISQVLLRWKRENTKP
jgi:hypothetical protein